MYTVAPNKDATYTFVVFFYLLVPEIKFGEVYNNLTYIYKKELEYCSLDEVRGIEVRGGAVL